MGLGGKGCRLQGKRRPDVCDGLCGKLVAARAQRVWGKHTLLRAHPHTLLDAPHSGRALGRTRLTRGEPRRSRCHAEGQRARRLRSARRSTDRIAIDRRRGGGASAATVPNRSSRACAVGGSQRQRRATSGRPRRLHSPDEARRGWRSAEAAQLARPPARRAVTCLHRPATTGRSRLCRRTSPTCG